MAHLVETLAYANEAPWHRLGVQVDNTIPPDDLLIKAGLDWEVQKKALYTEDNVAAEGHFGLVRSSDKSVLSVCKGGYKPVQNREALAFFREFIINGSMKMETAGSLDNGRYVFALASIQESFELAGIHGKDKVDGYLLFSSPHVCGKSMDILFTPIRVVCNNTLTHALRSASGKGHFKLRHSQKFEAQTAKIALGLAKEQLAGFKETSEFLARKRAKGAKLTQFFNEIWPLAGNDNGKLSTTAQAAMTVFQTQPGADLFPGTWWNAFNAVTFIIDHVAGRNDNNRLRKAWFGSGRAIKNTALELAISYANVA